MDSKGMAVVDLDILKSVQAVDQEFRSIMLLARELQSGDWVIDAGTLKTLEDLIFVARDHLQRANNRVCDRLAQYRELATAACEAVEDLREDNTCAEPPSNVVNLFGAARNSRGVA